MIHPLAQILKYYIFYYPSTCINLKVLSFLIYQIVQILKCSILYLSSIYANLKKLHPYLFI